MLASKMPLVNNMSTNRSYNECRLCWSKDNLVWMFAKRLHSEKNIKNMILITPGVEIYEKDVISQMICQRCCQLFIGMPHFRKQSQKQDIYIKKQYKENLKTSSVQRDNPSTGLRIETKKIVETKMETKEDDKPNQKVHQSVRDILKIYPSIKLPLICLKYNINPSIIIETEKIDNFLKKKTNSEQKYIRLPEYENRVTENSSSGESTYHISTSIMNADKKIIEGNYCSDDESDGTNKIILKSNKRRLSDNDLMSSADMTNISSSEPWPKKAKTCESPKQLYLNKSEPEFLCSICNSVHNNVRELKRHLFKHWSCEFCGLKFKTVGLKKAHIQSLCKIKKMMNQLPSVKLDKIELDWRMRSRYPEAFVGFPVIPGVQLNSSSTVETLGDKPPGDKISENQTSERDTRVNGCNGEYNDNTDDIIEILSHDDFSSPSGKETCNSTPIREKELVPVSNITQRKFCSQISASYSTTVTENMVNVRSRNFTNNPVNQSTTLPVDFTTPAVISTTSVVISSTPPVISSTSSVMSTAPPVISTITPVIPTSCPVSLKALGYSQSSVAVVKPDIKICGSAISDVIDTNLMDLHLIKELLARNKPLKINKDNSSNIEVPSYIPILVNTTNKNFVLTFQGLKNSLYLYKIPVFIMQGYNIRAKIEKVQNYSKPSNCKSQRTEKNKLHLWNDLTPIDVKVSNRSCYDQGANLDRIPVNTTPNISTPVLTSNCTITTTNAFNPTYYTLPNQQMYNRNNHVSTSVNYFTGSSNHGYTQVITSNCRIVNEVPTSKDLTYVLAGENTAEQQSETMAANSFTASNVQMYPQNVNMTSSVVSTFGVANGVSVAEDSRCVFPGVNISYPNDIRRHSNVDPFAIPNMVSQNFMYNAPNINNSHSLQNSLVVRK